jgi:AP2-like factor, euAP2 lineage
VKHGTEPTAAPRKYRGVYHIGNKANPWRAVIWRDGQEIHLGIYPNQEGALAAYVAAGGVQQKAGKRRNTSAVRVYQDQSYFEIEVGDRWAKVDVADMDTVIGHTWTLKRDMGEARRARPGGGTISMHHAILGLQPGSKLVILHRNEDGLDNRRANLILTNRSGQAAGRAKVVSSSSRFKGVRWDKNRAGWTAVIKVDQRERWLGLYGDEEDAARAYNQAALAAWGDLARLNEVPMRSPGTEDGRLRKPITSHYRGVSRDKSKKKWQARIKVEGQSSHLGTFENEDDAARAYNIAARQAWGDKARLNEVPATRKQKRGSQGEESTRNR